MLRRSARLCAFLVVALTAVARPARAGDITAFLTLPAPTDVWGRGYGAALTSTWFSVIALEGEAARLPADTPDLSMTSFTASAFLAPPIGFVTPYAGIGVGVFRQKSDTDSDVGTLRAYALGAKLKLGLFVLKGEYRKLELSGTPLQPMTARITAGAGISF